MLGGTSAPASATSTTSSADGRRACAAATRSTSNALWPPAQAPSTRGCPRRSTNAPCTGSHGRISQRERPNRHTGNRERAGLRANQQQDRQRQHAVRHPRHDRAEQQPPRTGNRQKDAVASDHTAHHTNAPAGTPNTASSTAVTRRLVPAAAATATLPDCAADASARTGSRLDDLEARCGNVRPDSRCRCGFVVLASCVPELRARGHDAVAPDLPSGDDSAGLSEYTDVVVDAIGDRRDLVVVGQSFGGFTGPLVCARVPVRVLVPVAAMVPSPGESPGDWWANTGWEEARREQAARSGLRRARASTRWRSSFTMLRRRWLRPGASGFSRVPRSRSHGRCRPGPTFRPGSFCAVTIDSFPLRLCVASQPIGCTSPPTRWTAATYLRCIIQSDSQTA